MNAAAGNVQVQGQYEAVFNSPELICCYGDMIVA